MKYDPEQCERLLSGGPNEMLWDANAADEGRGTPSSDYVDGWNDAVKANAIPLAEMLEAARREIDRLTRAIAARDDIIAAGQRTIDSGNEALRTLRQEWEAERARLATELDRAADLLDVTGSPKAAAKIRETAAYRAAKGKAGT